MRAEEFAIAHNKEYHNYCEIIILPDGDVQYANPSHQYKLCTLYGLDYLTDILDNSSRYLELLNRIPMEASPTHWMIEDLGVISCWFSYCIAPIRYTDAQIEALQTLRKHHCISSEFNVDVTIEKTLLQIRDSIQDEDKYERLFEDRSYARQELEELING